jgi:hypothetical protein
MSSSALRRSVALSCAAAACVLLVTACGVAASPGGPAGSSPCAPKCDGVNPGGPVVTAHRVSLDVTIYPAGNGMPYALTLRCDPDGGTVPDPATACAELLADPSLLEPQPVGHVIACPMVLASSARAVVDGMYLGRQVAETIVDGGCDLGRWATLLQIFRPTSSDLHSSGPGYAIVPGRA